MKPIVYIVAGTFDSHGGKPSGYMTRLITTIKSQLQNDYSMFSFKNGGSISDLKESMAIAVQCDVVLWFADVPSSENVEKTHLLLKKQNPTMTLFISKRNWEPERPVISLISRALQAHAQRILELQKHSNGMILSRLLDPLGNVYGDFDGFIPNVAFHISTAIKELTNLTRIRSVMVGPNTFKPNCEDFCSLSREVADKLTLVMKTETVSSRFFGNASFRCHSGFPAIKQNNIIYVSPRNVDKKLLLPDQFVPCELDIFPTVKYYGDIKPSVDAPIQISLFNELPHMNYSLHGHAYIKGLGFTKKALPCGVLEEVKEILNCDDIFKPLIAVNLLGHGFMVMSDTISSMKEFFSSNEIIARSVPENLYRL